MEIILQDTIANLGKLGDKVDVKAGFARNYLIPLGKAMPATKDNLVQFEAKRAGLEKQAAKALEEANQRASTLASFLVKIPVLVGEEGKMFGSVGTKDIADVVTTAGVPVQKREVILPHGALKEVGEHEVSIQLHSEVTALIRVELVAES